MNDAVVLKVKNLEKTYYSGKNKIKAVDGVSFDFGNNKSYALLGPNGAGKTTIIKMILNLVSPDKGEIEILGYKMPNSHKKVMKEIGTLLEGSRNLYWHMTVKENVYYFSKLKNKNKKEIKENILKWAERLNLSEKLNVEVGKLSRGMQQKASLVCALSVEPKILILDEPLLGLDIMTRFEIERIIKELKNEKTLIISSHDLRFIEKVSDEIFIINKGKVVAKGNIDDLRTKISYSQYKFVLNKKKKTKYIDEIEKIKGIHIKSYENNEDIDLIEITFENDELIFDFMNILKNNSVIPVEINNSGEPFEEIFKKIIEGEKNECI